MTSDLSVVVHLQFGSRSPGIALVPLEKVIRAQRSTRARGLRVSELLAPASDVEIGGAPVAEYTYDTGARLDVASNVAHRNSRLLYIRSASGEPTRDHVCLDGDIRHHHLRTVIYASIASSTTMRLTCSRKRSRTRMTKTATAPVENDERGRRGLRLRERLAPGARRDRRRPGRRVHLRHRRARDPHPARRAGPRASPTTPTIM